MNERRDGHSKLVLDKGERVFRTIDPHPHPIETLWREVGLPEYFLGNGGSNKLLYALYDAIARDQEILRANAVALLKTLKRRDPAVYNIDDELDKILAALSRS